MVCVRNVLAENPHDDVSVLLTKLAQARNNISYKKTSKNLNLYCGELAFTIKFRYRQLIN